MGVTMYNKIIRGNFSPPDAMVAGIGPEECLRVMRALRDDARGAVPFDVQAVSDYLYSHEKEVWNWHTDFPCLAPPFLSFWMETGRPRRLFSKEDGERPTSTLAERWGALFRVGPDNILHACLFMVNEHTNGQIAGPIAVFGLPLDESGRLRGDPTIGTYAPIRIQDGNEVLHSMMTTLFPFGLAISFLHCKNVAQVEHLPSRQERRDTERRGDPVTKFRTLAIEPMKQVLKHEGGLEKNGISKALHICRGHFHTYTQEKPMFGKYAGTFWVPAHVRGSIEAGVIAKDYAVKAPLVDIP